jgi:hypothetical protein
LYGTLEQGRIAIVAVKNLAMQILLPPSGLHTGLQPITNPIRRQRWHPSLRSQQRNSPRELF